MKNNSLQKNSTTSVNEKTMHLLRNRDTEFLKSLFTEVNPYLIKVCISHGIYKEKADEVIHDTWEKFFFNLDKFEGRSQIKTFICGILFNKIREHRRAQNKIVFEEDSDKLMNSPFTIDGWWKTSPHSPQKIIESKQTSQLIEDCLDGLTELQKSAFVLKTIEDQNSEEICNQLNVNVSNLRVLIYRAKDKLRKCLEGKVTLGNY